MSKRLALTPDHHKRAKQLADELRSNLPKEFTVAARRTPDGHAAVPDFHFVADTKIPGLYRAKVDSDFVMGRTKKPTGMRVRKSG